MVFIAFNEIIDELEIIADQFDLAEPVEKSMARLPPISTLRRDN